MPNPILVSTTVNDHGKRYKMHLVWCPGCDMVHGINTRLKTTPADMEQPFWTWNHNPKAPTFDPSLLVHIHGKEDPRKCHSFIRDGKWQFLSDCYHKLANQTVDMVPVPDWLLED